MRAKFMFYFKGELYNTKGATSDLQWEVYSNKAEGGVSNYIYYQETTVRPVTKRFHLHAMQ